MRRMIPIRVWFRKRRLICFAFTLVIFICFKSVTQNMITKATYDEHYGHLLQTESHIYFSSDDVIKLHGKEKDKFHFKDNKLIQMIRKQWLTAPSQGPLNLKDMKSNDFSQVGQSLMVDSILNKQEHGFFIECGAADGETFSNTLYFEKFRHWTGLLIEPDPQQYSSLLNKQRNAFTINACLSDTKYPQLKLFTLAGLESGLGEYFNPFQHYRSKNSSKIQIQCFPLVSILEAMKIKVVDYFSLDVEGAEMDILSTIPFDQVIIKVISIEYRTLDTGFKIDPVASLERLNSIRAFFKKTNLYQEAGILPLMSPTEDDDISPYFGLDVIFQRTQN